MKEDTDREQTADGYVRELIERDKAITTDNENLRRQLSEAAARMEIGCGAAVTALHVTGGIAWLDAIDPLTTEDVPALSLVPDPEGSPMLYVVDSRFQPNRVVATVEFNKDGCAPDLRAATHKQRVFLLARLALRAEV